MSVTRAATASLCFLLLSTPLSGESRCSFAHYPVAPGDVNEYRMTSHQLGADGAVIDTTSYIYREEITSVEDDRYRTSTTSAGNTSESEWLCTAEGLAVKLGEFPEMKVTTTGVSIPTRMDVGGVWIQTFQSEGEGFSQTMKTVNRVTAREEITVEAGTFPALRVDYEIETTIPDQPLSILRGTQWYAPGVGLVKSTSVVPMPEGEIQTIETTVELTSRTSR